MKEDLPAECDDCHAPEGTVCSDLDCPGKRAKTWKPERLPMTASEMTNPALGTVESARDIVQTIALAMKNGYTPDEILADGGPIAERVWAEATHLRAALARPDARPYINTDDPVIEAAYRRLDLSAVPHPFRASVAFEAGWKAAAQLLPRLPSSK